MRYLSFIALAATTSIAFASSTATVKPGQFVLVNADSSLPAGYDATTNRFDTLQACSDAAAKLKSANYKCNQSNAVTVTSTCADEKAPHIQLTQVDLNGTKAWDLPPFQWIGDSYTEQEWLFVHGPTWPNGYPNCWVRGWEDPTLWRENPKAEAPNVFLERIEPGMTAADIEMPDVMEPVCKPDGPADCPGVPLT